MSAPTDLAYWQGGVDKTLETHGSTLRDLELAQGEQAVRIGALEVSVGKIAVKIGVGATLGSLLGGGIVAMGARLIFGG